MRERDWQEILTPEFRFSMEQRIETQDATDFFGFGLFLTLGWYF